MLFASYINENSSQNKSKNDSKSKLTNDRVGLLRDATRLIKEGIGSSILSHTTFRIDKEYNKEDFINGKCEFITVAHIKKVLPYMTIYSNSIIEKMYRFFNKAFKIALSEKLIIFNPMENEEIKKRLFDIELEDNDTKGQGKEDEYNRTN